MSDDEARQRGSRYGFEPDPEHPGWLRRSARSEGRFPDVFGAVAIRFDDERLVRVRFEAERRHSNLLDYLHGGYLMAAIDQAMFMIAASRNAVGAHGAVTVGCSTDFIAPGQIGPALDIVGEVLRESSRLVFLRGLAEQEGRTVASFSGTLSKVSPRS